ncbi:unnamed protein product [Closterium sp. Yama58-4]|nr:unnamed protein product [Closterium sp. Yama58-4]
MKCRHLFHEDVGASYQVILAIVIDDILWIADCGAAMSGVAGFGMASELAATLASQALQENGLPPGLLPLQEVVQSTNTRTGPFQVKLSHSVERKIHGNLVRYSSEVRGTICRGKITNLKGVHVRRLMLWLSVDSIESKEANSSDIHFRVGPVSEGIPRSAF